MTNEPKDPFRSLTPDELAKVEPLTREQVEAAVAEGRQLAAEVRERFRAMRRRPDLDSVWRSLCEVQSLVVGLEKRIARIEERLGMKP